MPKPKTKTKSAKPVPKVTSAGAAGALTTLAVFIAGRFGVDVPADVAAAGTTIIATVAAYMTPWSYGTG